MAPNASHDRVAVVVNGNAKQVTDDLVEILDQIIESGDLFVSRNLDEGRDIARRITEQGYRTVLTGGGDGTFTQMVTWIAQEAERLDRQPPRFGLLRLGTGNALAWVVGAQNSRSRGVFADLARLKAQGGSRRLRLLDVDDKLAPFIGFGADALALQHFAELKQALSRVPLIRRFAGGLLAYGVAVAARSGPEVFFRPRPRVRIVNEGSEAYRLGVNGQAVGSPVGRGEVLYSGPCTIVCMSTIPYWGFGARVFPYAHDRDDRCSLRVVDFGPLVMAWNLRALWKGTYRGDLLHDFLVDRVSIQFEHPVAFQIGGDPVGCRQGASVGLSRRQIDVVDYYGPPPVDGGTV